MRDKPWRPVVGYEGIYEVRQGTDGGRVRRVAPVNRSYVGRELGRCSRRTAGTPYWRAVLSRPGERPRLRFLHHVILEAFVGPRPEGCEACHQDDNPSNNTIPNLYWGTRSDNLRDAHRNGRMAATRRMRGDAHPNIKMTLVKLSALRSAMKRGEVVGLAKRFGVSGATLWRWKKRILSGDI